MATYKEDLKVGVLAVGGFSHPVIDEEMDRKVLNAIAENDVATLTSLPRNRFQAANGQALVWLAAAGALQGKQANVLDYIPCYRSEGGTGCGMGFAIWK